MIMKTILQALIDEIHYPIPVGHAENRLMTRGLYPCDECTPEVLNSKPFIGAIADSLYMLISATSFSEADKSVGSLNIASILKEANTLYKTIGESEKALQGSPVVTIMN
jgi:hypothetical protein